MVNALLKLPAFACCAFYEGTSNMTFTHTLSAKSMPAGSCQSAGCSFSTMSDAFLAPVRAARSERLLHVHRRDALDKFGVVNVQMHRLSQELRPLLHYYAVHPKVHTTGR